ncbi:MAG TPA: lipoyl(octanoyl) transferase LipB [Fimbriimonadaceae bacterium]|mgnify:CR=1 FL=1|nr:lipoyl(octanoyl) transferase LipB [Fimbriimonadaceae bacterium]HRJ32336.1 lipoyl(octanoyl) transferase LipB [Fimbriimonadaceae bacterium]
MIRGHWCWLGSMDYATCFAWQRVLADQVAQRQREDVILFVEHPPVLTLGANFHAENLLETQEAYRQKGIQVEPTDRGGDVTFHNPGQLVIYPIVDVAQQGKDLHRWLRDLEESVIIALRAFGLNGRRFAPHTGVWIEDRKTAAIGIKVKRWINLHGIALNCNNDLDLARLIVPCGIHGYAVTSLTQELGREVGVRDALPVMRNALEHVLGFTPLELRRSELESQLGPELQ